MDSHDEKKQASVKSKSEKAALKKEAKSARQKAKLAHRQAKKEQRTQRQQEKQQHRSKKTQSAKQCVNRFFATLYHFFRGQVHHFQEKQRLTLKRKEAEAQLDYIVEKSAQNDELLAGRLAYDQLYGKQTEHLKRQSKVIYILAFSVVVSVFLLFLLGSQSKIDPIIVKVDGNNQILDVEQAAHINYSSIEPKMYTYWILQFVRNARSISVDGQLESTMVKSAYAFTQGSATQDLQHFFISRDPYNTASKEVVTIQINAVIPNVGGSPRTTQVEWTEIAKNPKTGQVLSQYQYTGQFTFRQSKKPPKDKAIALYNPLGFYITAISWSQNYTNNPV